MKSGGEMIVAAPLRWDEACFMVPALRALMGSGLVVGVLCPAEQREFWETIPGLKVVDFLAAARMRTVAAGLAGDWSSSLAWEQGLAAEAFKVVGIPTRLGLDGRKLNKFMTKPLSVTVEPLAHRVQDYLGVVEELGVPTGMPEYFAPVDLKIPAVARAVLLCPGSDFGASYEWGLERWVEVGTRLLAAGRQVTVASVERGRDLGSALAERLGGEVECFLATPLTRALPLLDVHGLVVAADGSLPHLAAHVGATCVTLFGPNDPKWKRPLGSRHAVVRRHVECAPCLLAKCPLDGRCQEELDVERVWQAVLGKLG